MKRLILPASLALFVATFPSLPAAPLDGLPPGDEPTLDRWWASFGQGGLVQVVTDEATFTIPLSVTSDLPRYHPDGTRDHGNRTVVLRGQAGLSSMALILDEDDVGLIVNGPNGENMKVNLPQGRLLPADADPPSAGQAQEPPGFRGPLQVTELVGPIEVPHVAGASAPLAEGERATVLAPMLHVSPQGGASIEISKHIWSSSPVDPVNAVLYHHATGSNSVITMNNAGWASTSCGSTKQAYVKDALHGGSDSWQSQNGHYQKPDWACLPPLSERYHARRFTSATGDTHYPGFSQYSLMPAHWEDSSHQNVNPQRGQDQLLNDLRYSSHINGYWLRQIAYTSTECENCARWSGWVDFYNRIQTGSSDDTCYSSGPQRIIFTGTVTTVYWYCTHP